MLIDVVPPESWDQLNDQMKSSLGVVNPVRIRCYRGIAQAVFEIAQGTAQFMSHKKSIGVIQGQTFAFEGLLAYYYKEVYEVVTLSHLKMENVKEWVDALKRETLFVLYSEDHPVTGELYPFVDELDKLLNDKRIFSFRISHARHFYERVDIRPYTVRICSHSDQAAIALTGERFRSPPLIVHSATWRRGEFQEEIQKSFVGRQMVPELVTTLEQELASVAKPYFVPSAPRLMDRAVCVFEDVSAEAVALKIFAKLSISPQEGWQKMATTNMCHWSTVKMFRHWWQPTPSLEQLRGLLLFGSEVLARKDFAKLVISSYEEVKAQQSWDV
ncbi:MAG: hypothetical protein AAGB31_00895 [Bdellovibrio sp.]